MSTQVPPSSQTIDTPLSCDNPVIDAQSLETDSMHDASRTLLLLKSTTLPTHSTTQTSAKYQVELPFAMVVSTEMPKALSDATLPSTSQPAIGGTKLRVSSVFKACKRGRYEEEQKEGWNVDARCHAGGIQALTARHVEMDAKNARMDHQLGTTTKKLTSPDMMLVFCMHVVPGGVPLAKWPIPEISKELKIMEDLRLFSIGFAPNTKGIIHPYVKFSSVDIPIADFDNFVAKAFPRWTKKDRGFYNFASSVGLSKCPQLNQAGERVVTLTFCPSAYNNNLDRLCTAHGRKPKIIPQQCAESCCHGKWTPEIWQSALARR